MHVTMPLAEDKCITTCVLHRYIRFGSLLCCSAALVLDRPRSSSNSEKLLDGLKSVLRHILDQLFSPMYAALLPDGCLARGVESKLHACGAVVARTQEIDTKGGRMPTGILFGQVAVVLGVTLSGIWAATQWTAATLGYQVRLGLPWFDLFGIPIYHPWRLFEWWYFFDAYAPDVFLRGGIIAASSGVNRGVKRYQMAL